MLRFHEDALTHTGNRSLEFHNLHPQYRRILNVRRECVGVGGVCAPEGKKFFSIGKVGALSVYPVALLKQCLNRRHDRTFRKSMTSISTQSPLLSHLKEKGRERIYERSTAIDQVAKDKVLKPTPQRTKWMQQSTRQPFSSRNSRSNDRHHKSAFSSLSLNSFCLIFLL
jgi:hypothetical protein